MAVLDEGDWEFRGFVLGGDKSNSPVYIKDFNTGTTQIRDQDALNGYGNNVHFGRDLKSPPKWMLYLAMGDFTAASALTALDELSGLWHGADVSTPGLDYVLRYRLGGRTRRVYGRPRALPYDAQDVLYAGHVVAQAEFQLTEGLTFDDDAQSLILSTIPLSAPGFTFPLVSPFTTGQSQQRQGQITNGGKASTPFTAVIKGPISNPWVSGSGWKLSLATNLQWDQSITIDTRKGTVRRNDGTNLHGVLSRTSRLSTARIKPGNSEIKFGGNDLTGTSSCTVTWRSAYYAL